MKHITIAIDGPSGAGKSTIARMLSEKMDISYLDTGAMYRAVTLFSLNNNLENEAEVCSRLSEMIITFKANKVFLNGIDITVPIREKEVTQKVSLISSYSCVRTFLVGAQRKIASESSCVLDGRDIGTVVLPKATYKFFLTASPEIRAKRRYDEHTSDLSYEDVLKDINRRDLYDSTRTISPLKQADDAIFIDASELSITEVLEKMMKEMT